MTVERRVIAVTGGALGVGRAIAISGAHHGACVAVLDRDEKALRSLERELRPPPVGQHVLVAGDATGERDINAFVERVRDIAGDPYALVNNVGGSFGYRAFTETSIEEFERTLSLNLRGTFLCSQAVLQPMIAAGAGRIINITSIAHERAIPKLSAYGAAKAAVVALTRSMAVELASSNVMVNAIAPGHLLTPAAERIVPAELRAGRDAVIPVGHHGTPEDIARVAMFLIDEATFLTGAVITVDGGTTAMLPQPPSANASRAPGDGTPDDTGLASTMNNDASPRPEDRADS